MKRLLCLAILVSCAAPVSASIIVDGTRDATYGSAVAVQTVESRYGDEDGIGAPNGSELDAAYAKIWNGRLYFMLTGNLENDGGNKLSVYIDSKAGGENTLTNTPDYDSMTGPNWRSNTLGGMTFDASFTADYHLIVRRNGANLEVDFVDRAGGVTEQVPGAKGMAPFVRIDALPDPHLTNFVTSVGMIAAGALGPNASGSSLTQALDFGFNNSNSAGVLGRKADLTACGGTDACIAADPVAAAAVATGLEFSIDLADLGAPLVGSEIKIAAMIGNGDFNDYSNQFLGGLPAPHAKFPAASLPFNLANEAGNQYFSVAVTAEVPEPAALALVGLAVVGAGLFRREQRV